MKVLISGIYGQDGIILSKIYKKRKIKVFGFVKQQNRKKNKFLNNYTQKIFTNNLSNFFLIKKHLTEINPDIIIHLAANNVGAKDNKGFNKFYLKNLLCFFYLFFNYLLFFKKTKFLFAGSSMMYGEKNAKISEKTNFNSKSLYGTYKVHSFYIMRVFKKIFNLRASCLILFNHDSIYRNKNFLIPRIISSYLNNKKRDIIGILKSNIYLDISHAEEICEMIYKISLNNQFNYDKIILSSGKLTSLNKVFFRSMNIKKSDFKNLKAKKIGLIGDNTILKEKFIFRPKKNIFHAVKELLLFYKKNKKKY